MSAPTIIARVALVITLVCLDAAWAASAEPAPPPPSAAPSSAPPRPRATRPGASPQTAVVIQPRPTGYFVGDLVTQRILLEGRGQTYTPISLPPPGRVNSWFERRRDTLVTDDSSRSWLVVEYQFLNAPKAVTAATLPAWRLAVKGTYATAPITLTIPAVSLNIAPLSPPGSPEQVGTRDLRPDHVPPDIDIIPIRHALALWASGLALTLTAWLAWVLWRNQRAYATQPFAHALRQLRTLPDDEPRAWQILHRAFDRTAGRVIQNATLPLLFERAPHLAPARAEIEEFFVTSTQRFFATARVGANSEDPEARSASAVHSGGPQAHSASATNSRGPQAHSASAANSQGPHAHSGAGTNSEGPYAHSMADTNSEATAPQSVTPTIRDRSRVPPAPLALCQALRRIEKRHEP